MNCEKCNTKLTRQEEARTREAMESSNVRIICVECAQEENNEYDDFHYYSDVDHGL